MQNGKYYQETRLLTVEKDANQRMNINVVTVHLENIFSRSTTFRMLLLKATMTFAIISRNVASSIVTSKSSKISVQNADSLRIRLERRGNVLSVYQHVMQQGAGCGFYGWPPSCGCELALAQRRLYHASTYLLCEVRTFGFLPMIPKRLYTLHTTSSYVAL